MLKQKRQIFELLFMVSDIIVVSLAWLFAYWLRFHTDFIPVEKGVPPVKNYLSMLLFIALIWAFIFKRMGLYRPMRGIRRTKEIWLLVQANILSLLCFIAVTYLFREKAVPFSRLVFVYFGVFAIIMSSVQRLFLRGLLREIRRRGYNLRYLLIVGAGKVAEDIASRMRLNRELGIQIVGCLSQEGIKGKGPRGVPILGSYTDLPQVLSHMDIDQVVVALPLQDHHLMPEIMASIGDRLIDVKLVPDISQFVRLGGTIEEFEGMPVISLQESPLEGINLYTKRALDVIFATLALVVLSPLMLLIALLVKLGSRGPVLYRQERVSFDGSPFPIYKFRTMYADAEFEGPGWTTPGDERVTPLGRILRAWSLDELPQLFNVLRGDMSLVGPRPERPIYIEEFRKHVPRYMLRHKVPAGMTGWAQVHGWRGDTSIDKRIEYDLYYIEHWSIFFDLKIMALTLIRGFRGSNAY